MKEQRAAREAAHNFKPGLNTAYTQLEGTSRRLQAQPRELSQYEERSQRQRSQIVELTQRLESAQPKIRDFTVNHPKLAAELSVKDDMIERLMAQKQQRSSHGEPERRIE